MHLKKVVKWVPLKYSIPFSAKLASSPIHTSPLTEKNLQSLKHSPGNVKHLGYKNFSDLES